MDDSLAPRLLDMRQEPSLASAAVILKAATTEFCVMH